MMEALAGADLLAEALSSIGCQVTLQTQSGEVRTTFLIQDYFLNKIPYFICNIYLATGAEGSGVWQRLRGTQ